MLVLQKKMKTIFGGVDELRSQNLFVGSIGVLKLDRIILPMITKRVSWMCPSVEDFDQTVFNLRVKCEELGVTVLSCPFIGTGRDKISQSHVLMQLKKVFCDSKVNVFIWRWKSGHTNPRFSLLSSNVMLAGDSSFLRVLGLCPGTRQGHVISGGNLLSIQFSLQHSPPSQCLFFMAGTNDLLRLHNEKISKHKASTQVRALLRRLMKTLVKLAVDVTMLTIPPCPLLDEECAAFNVVDFNNILVKLTLLHGFNVIG